MTDMVEVRLVRMSDPDIVVTVLVSPEDVDKVRGCVLRCEGTPGQEQMRLDMQERVRAARDRLGQVDD